ncbi:MAG: hypothetical protein AABX96_04435 [Nanoarchaeota archaeon]
MTRKTFSYDYDYDNLIVSMRQENEKVRENFEMGDIVFSLTGNRKIVSIDIRSASNFLQICGITAEMLKDATNIEFTVIPKLGAIYLVLKIESVKGEHKMSKSIPLILPLSDSLVNPLAIH